MKQALFLATAIIVLAFGCRKKADQKNCYECYRYDSLSLMLGTAKPIGYMRTHIVDSSPHCGYTEDLKNLLIKSSTKVDTFYISEMRDSIELNNWTMKCEIY